MEIGVRIDCSGFTIYQMSAIFNHRFPIYQMSAFFNRRFKIYQISAFFNHRFTIYQMSAGGQEAAVQAGDPS